jgi:hypothetical protein
MRTTIRLKDELLIRAKRKAAREGRSLTSLIEEGLLTVLTGGSRSKAPANALPVSERTGGLKPGVDINRNAALADLADSENGWISQT